MTTVDYDSLDTPKHLSGTCKISCKPELNKLFTRSPVVKKANTSGILAPKKKNDGGAGTPVVKKAQT